MKALRKKIQYLEYIEVSLMVCYIMSYVAGIIAYSEDLSSMFYGLAFCLTISWLGVLMYKIRLEKRLHDQMHIRKFNHTKKW